MFRLNVHLPDAIGDRLNDLVAQTGQTKVSITTAALDEYMKRQEVQRKLIDQLADPETFAKVCSAVGVDFSQFSNN